MFVRTPGGQLTINNIAALHFYDFFKLDLATAGIIAGLFGLMNIFARTLGGIFSDICAVKIGLRGRVWFMGASSWPKVLPWSSSRR